MELKKLIQKRWKSSAKGFSEGVREEIKKDQKKWRDYIDKKISPEPGIKILDTCCGPGFLSIIFSGEGRDITAIDECDTMLEEAEKNAAENGVDINFVKGDCHKLDFPDSTFDMVISRNALWTLYNPAEAYREWVRVLKPGGRLIIFESSWCLEYQNKTAMEKKAALRKKYKIPVQERNYYGDQSLAQELDARCMLGKVERPDWDYSVLEKVKMDIEIDTEAWKYLWDDEMKKYFGYAPMFMINARKIK